MIDLADFAPQSPLSNFYKTSRKAARKRWHGRHAYPAEVRMEKPHRELTIVVGSQRKDAADASWSLIGTIDLPPELPRHLDMEVISLEGPHGFLVRLVKRVFSPEFDDGVKDVAEYVFRVPQRDLVVCSVCDPAMAEPDPEIPLMPLIFCMLIEMAPSCHVLLGGTPIEISSVYHHRLHQVGAKKEV